MASKDIPNSQGLVRQVNSGDIYGELWGTFGIDLTSSPGKIKTSRRLTNCMSEVKMDNDDVQAFALWSGSIVAFMRGQRVAYLNATRNPRKSGNWVSSSGGGLDIGQESDSVVFDGKLLVSTGTNIASTTATQPGPTDFDQDWWTNVVSGAPLQTGKPHTMDVSRLGQETLFVTDGNVVRYYNTTAGHTTITLADGYTACCLATDAYATFVGTYTDQGEALVYEIYVGEDAPRRSYPIDGSAVLSMAVIDTVPYIVTDRGYIQRYNGRGFVTVAQFPFAEKGVTLAGLEIGNINDENTERAIHPKGMRSDGRKLFININTNNQLIETLASNPEDDDDIFTNVVVDERSPSGVWEFNTETNVLNHRFPLTLDTYKGYHRQQTSGPILVTNNQYTRLLTAGRVESTRTEIYAEDSQSLPLGYIVTPEVQSNSLNSAWETLGLHIDTLQENESVEIKYMIRDSRMFPVSGAITWSANNEFTTTDDFSQIVADSNGEYNYEVEILNGYNAGEVAQVTKVVASTNTYTVTVDSTIGQPGQTGNVRLQQWHKIDYSYTDDNMEFDNVGIAEPNPWIKFKIIFRGLATLRRMYIKDNVKNEK